MTTEERDSLIECYANHLAQHMDVQTLLGLAAESIIDEYKTESDESITTEIEEMAPEVFAIHRKLRMDQLNDAEDN